MTDFPLRAHETFAAEPISVSRARRFTRRTLEEWGAADLVDSVSLVVSELVTNAVVHTGMPARLDLARQGHDVRVEVEDRHPQRALPMVTERPPDDSDHGRGLMITTSLVSSWGVEYTATTKRVWAVCGPGAAGTGVGTRPVDVPHSFEGALVAVVEISPDGQVRGWNRDATTLFGWSAEEVAGRRYVDLLDPASESAAPAGVDGADWSGRWQGGYAVVCKGGTSAPVFASHTRAGDDKSTVALVVPARHRELIEHPAASPTVEVHPDPISFGLRDDALVRLSVDDYLALAAERVRDPVSADATYVLMFRDLDDELEVVAVSGLSDGLLGTRLAPGSPGAPDLHHPNRPVVLPDLAEDAVPLLEGTDLRSLVVVPLVAEGRLVGALAAASAVVDGFDDAAAALLQRFADSLALAADRARLQASERERRGWLSFIADAGDLLAGSLDQDMTMAITGQIVVPRIARWCAIHLADVRGKAVLQQVWHEDEKQVEALRAALETVREDQLAAVDTLVLGYAATSIPLVARGRRIGFLTVGRTRGELLRSEFFLVAESIARRAALAIDNARAHGDLQAVGRALQDSLLPPAAPSAPGFDVGVVYEPAGHGVSVGGDFYDFFPLGRGTWCFVVGDVCGTGAQAAAVTGLARHTIQALMRAGLPVDATLERLNTAILDEGARARFLTLVCGTLRLEGSSVRLEIVNAGHPPPFLVDREGTVRRVGTPQTLLGVVEHVAFTTETHTLARGDLLVAVTDGVLERRDGDRMLEDDGVAEALADTADLPAQAVAERIRRLVVDFTDAPQHDDLAILAIRVQAGAAAT